MQLSATSGMKVSDLAIAGVFVLAFVPAAYDRSFTSDAAMVSVVLAIILATLSIIDWRHFILPNVLTLPLLVAGPAVAAWFGGTVLWSVASAAVGFGLLWAANRLYLHLRGQEGLGMGDAKLLAAAGSWLGMQALPTVLLWATGLALLAAVTMTSLGRPMSSKMKLPFGPALAVGFWLTWLYGALA